eukprot:10644827-Lingulodinium_polyedra.AAC.1
MKRVHKWLGKGLGQTTANATVRARVSRYLQKARAIFSPADALCVFLAMDTTRMGQRDVLFSA